ncbi:MAG TPA: signal peptidase I, partial [Acidimicrobiales bacterium]|nr:signal peptidase I [Acidimicrobiales bacterium]
MDGDGDQGGAVPPVESPAPAPEAEPERKSNRWIIELLGVVVVALVVAFLLRTFVIATYSIPSGSMEPTLQVGDRIVVDKLSYHLHGVGRGNIVVFSTPPKEDCAGAPVANLVKRVIGLPGETVSLSGGNVFINGRVLAEPWLPASEQGRTYPGPSP